ncbi:InlB B-repeat-containing protein [Anaerococcus cruorum]|uniref:InlB B-repeat-containing protein n=1 Tax=Anaerococcus cruorum TaxID=3115617 RepID=A0ABW9MTV9_9FIRM
MKYKLMSAIMAFSMLVSSTIAPLAASKSYASADVEQNTSIMNKSTNEVKDDEKPAETSDTQLDIPEKTEEVKEQTPVDTKTEEQQSEIQVEREEETNKEATSDTPQIETEEIEEIEKIVKKSDSATLYEDSSYTKLSSEDIDIKITGNMPENGTIKAYEIQNAITDMEKENVLAFGFEIFDKDDNLYDKSSNDEYKIEIKSSKLRNLDKVYFYKKDEADLRFTEINDFSKLSNQIKLDSKADEFAVAKDIEKEEEETLTNQVKDKEVKSPFITNQDNEEELNNELSKEKEVEDPKDILDSLTSSINQKEIPATINENPNPTNNLELIDWKKDFLDVIAGNLKADKSDKEETIKKSSDTEEDSESKNKSEELPKGENFEEIKAEAESKEEDSKENPQSTIDNESESKEDYEKSEKKSETNKIEEETEEKLTYQQVLADIYTDKTYSQKSNDGTRIKLSGDLPGYTKVKAYPVEIEIEGKEILAAYDITIFDENDKEYKVSERNDINVQITNQKIRKASEVEVYHKEDEFAPEEKVVVDKKINDTVTFKADSFSIYAVTDPDARAVTFVFLNRNENNEREVWDTQTIRNGEKLVEPELPIFSYKGKFEGWHYYNIDTDTFGKKFDFEKPVTVTESSPKIIYLKGKYPDVAYINFIDRKEVKNSDGSISYVNEILSTKEIPLGSRVTTEDVPVLPGESGTVFSHWATKPEGRTAFDFNTPITKDYIQSVQGADNFVKLDLYAVFKKALTVTFDSQGGTHVNKQIVYSGDKVKLSDLTKPAKPGYQFRYWSTSIGGSQFNPNTPITKDTTLYAVYAPLNVKFTINHLRENPNDDGYSLFMSETRNAVAGTYTNKDSSSYQLPSRDQNAAGMVYDHADSSRVIRGDNGTEINIYYKRKKFVYRIFTGVWPFTNDIVKENVKWGADTSPYFNLAKTRLGGGYTFKEDSVAGQSVSYPIEMPQKDYTLRAWPEGSNEWNVRFIDVDTNALIRLDKQSSLLDSGLQSYNGGEKITGFTFQYVERPGLVRASPSKTHANGGESEVPEVWVFYKRNTHTLTFSTNGSGADIIINNVPYASNLGQYAPPNYVKGQTTNADKKVFAGWYDNPSGAGNPVDFSKLTMPDNDLKFYAKWDLPTYTVTAYKQRNNAAAGVIEQRIKEGGTVDKSKLIADKPPIAQNTPGSELRWYAFIDGILTEYNFADPVTSDIYLYPVWVAPEGNDIRPLSQIYRVKYKAPQEGGTDYIYTDPNDYVNNAEAIVIPPYVNNEYRFPPDKDNPTGKQLSMPKDKVFEGWVIDKNSEFTSVKDPNMLNKIYRPGDIINVIGNIMFKPIFNEYRVTTLTLKEIAPNGSNLDDIVYESRNKPSDLPDGINDNRPTEDLRNNDIIKLPQPRATNSTGFTFLGWSTTEDSTKGKIFKPGQEVMITDENMPNILYGIWERDKYKVTIKNNVTGDDITNKDTQFKVKYTLEGKTYEKVYTIENGASVDVEIPYGSNISIESLSDRLVKYKYKDEVYNSNVFTLNSLDKNIDVIFESQPIPPPTGLIDDIAPMALMLALASMAFAYRLYKRNKLAGGIDE